MHNEQHLNGAKRLQAQWMYPKWGNNNLPIEKSGLVKRQTRRNIAQNNAFLHRKSLFDVNIIYLCLRKGKIATKV